MKIIVVGCGSIGRRHAKNLLSLGHEVSGVDLNEEYRGWVEENLKVKTYSDFVEAIKAEGAQACFICTPPNSHIPLAKTALENNLNVFIEKPISNKLAGIEGLEKTAEEKKLIISVGYNLRFNPGIMKLKEFVEEGKIGKVLSARLVVGQYLPDWRPWQNYKESYSGKSGMGGGIILDASHEIDYARWLFGKATAVTCVAKKVSKLEVDVEDNAEVIVEFENGSVANIHLDFVRRDYRRGCEIVGSKGTIELFFNDKIVWFDAEGKETKEFDVSGDVNLMYVNEAAHFIECVEKGSGPLVSADEGRKSLVLALEAKKSAEEGKKIKVDV